MKITSEGGAKQNNYVPSLFGSLKGDETLDSADDENEEMIF